MATADGKKTGGRKKGTPNKRNSSVTQYLNEKGADPIEALSNLLLEALEKKDTPQISYLAIQLAPYHSPKLASSKIEANLAVSHEEALNDLD